MAQYAVVGSGYSGTATGSASTTYYGTLGTDFPLDYQSAEADSKVTCRGAPTVSLLTVNIQTNGNASTTTLQFRHNAANGNQSLSIASSTTGEFQDTTDSDVLADGDTYDLALTFGASVGAMGKGTLSALFATSGQVLTHLECSGGGTGGTGSGTAFYFSASGDPQVSNTEADVQNPALESATLSNLQAYVSANGRSSTTFIDSRVGGANGNQTVSVAGSTTGYFEDTTHSDTLASGNLFNFKLVNGTGSSGTVAATLLGMKYSGGSVSGQAPVYNGSGASIVSAITCYGAWFGEGPSAAAATEASCQQVVPMAITAKTLSVEVGANTIAASSTLSTRIASAAGAQSVSIASTTTGFLQDTTHHDTIAAGALADYKIVVGTSASNSLTIASIGQLTESPLQVAATGFSATGSFGSATASGAASPLGFSATVAFGTPAISSAGSATGFASTTAFGAVSSSSVGTATGISASGSMGSGAGSDSDAASALTCSGAMGAAGGSDSTPATGVAATGALGAATASTATSSGALTASGSFGAPAGYVGANDNGFAATAALGVETASTGASASGFAATGAIGPPTLAETFTVSGVALTGAFGTASGSGAPVASGFSCTGAVGSVAGMEADVAAAALACAGSFGTGSSDILLSGLSTSASLGAPNITPAISFAASALTATGALGSASAQDTIPGAGVDLTGALGSISIPNYPVAGSLTATGAFGSSTADVFAAPAGLSASGSFGSGAGSTSFAALGLSATAACGSSSGYDGVSGAGLSATGSLGSVIANTDYLITIVGVSATGAFGASSEAIGATATGFSASGAFGAATAQHGVTAQALTASGVLSAGSIAATASAAGFAATGAIGAPTHAGSANAAGIACTGAFGAVSIDIFIPSLALTMALGVAGIGAVSIAANETGFAATGILGPGVELVAANDNGMTATGAIGAPGFAAISPAPALVTTGVLETLEAQNEFAIVGSLALTGALGGVEGFLITPERARRTVAGHSSSLAIRGRPSGHVITGSG